MVSLFACFLVDLLIYVFNECVCGPPSFSFTFKTSKILSSDLQSKDLQMFNILLAALCSTGARWARAFDLLRLRWHFAEP